MKKVICFWETEMEYHETLFGYKIYKVTKDGRAKEKQMGYKASPFARCIPSEKIVIVYDEFFKVPEEVQTIIFLHEVAHMKHPEFSEDQCDQFAADHCQDGQFWLERARAFTDVYIPIIRKELGIV